ncbi:MAG TPA: RNA polymerase sigma factor [Kofleriaceae bacterium]
MFEPVHVERVIRHLVRFGSSRADAEDLAQEALVIAWTKQPDLDRDRSLDGWLYGIARNVYRNHARALRRRRVPIEEPELPAPDLAATLMFHAALAALPEPQQDIVILHELEEYTLKETARLLAIPFDTAKDRLKRARETLREHLGVVPREREVTRKIARGAAPAVLAAVLAAVPKPAAAATTSGLVVAKVLVAGALGLVAGIAVDRLALRPPTRGVAPAPAIVANVEPTAAIADAAIPDAAETVPAPPSTPPVRPSPAVPAVNEELVLVDAARDALRRHDPAAALTMLMRHERLFATGELAEERDILVVEAYLATGDREHARHRLATYRANHPHGLHAKRADAAEHALAN